MNAKGYYCSHLHEGVQSSLGQAAYTGLGQIVVVLAAMYASLDVLVIEWASGYRWEKTKMRPWYFVDLGNGYPEKRRRWIYRFSGI